MKARQILIAVFTIFLVAGCPQRMEPNFICEGPCLRIVTYNVNWGFVKPQNVVEFFDNADADIIFLQETHRRWESALRNRLIERYPYYVFEDWSGAGGIAIMSRYELNNVRLIEPKEGWFPALLADVKSPLGLVQYLNVHLRPPLSDSGSVRPSAYYQASDIHLKELQGFMKKTDAKRPMIIAGDFNENENSKAIQWLLKQGFTDALSTYDTYSKTWKWEVSYGISLKNRYDHIIISEQLDCLGAYVQEVEASDHMPVLAVIQIRNPDKNK